MMAKVLSSLPTLCQQAPGRTAVQVKCPRCRGWRQAGVLFSLFCPILSLQRVHASLTVSPQSESTEDPHRSAGEPVQGFGTPRIDNCAVYHFPHSDLTVLFHLRFVLGHHQCSAEWFLTLSLLPQAHIPCRGALNRERNVSHVGSFMFSTWGAVSAREKVLWDLSGAIVARVCPERVRGTPVAC